MGIFSTRSLNQSELMIWVAFLIEREHWVRTLKRGKRGEAKLLSVQSEAIEAQDFNCDLKFNLRTLIFLYNMLDLAVK